MNSSLFRMLLVALLCSFGIAFSEEYTLGPDSQRQPGVPQGTVTKHTWTSKIFPGTVRDYWIYVPAQYKKESPACVMVFQDGGGYTNPEGTWRAPVVFDNLIHKGEMPVTIGIFINPGVLPALGKDQRARYNRSFEYDALGDRYARFLVEEILPEVGKQYSLTSDPNERAIAGSSSGGIAAFTVAWNRPDVFRRVMSFVGSYTNLRGGENIASMIRKTEPKPLRVFLQDGEKDQNIYSGNWYIANQDVASALAYAGYDSKFVVGTEGHNGKHGAAILPDALRWLWRDSSRPIPKPTAAGDRQFSNMIIDPGNDWELVSQGHRFTEGPAVDRQGNLFFTDIPNNRIFRVIEKAGLITQISSARHVVETVGASVFKEDSGGANGLMFGPDGRLYACQNGRKRIVAYSIQDGKESIIAEDVNSNDLAVAVNGGIYFTDPPHHQVWYIDPKGAKRVVHEGIQFPNGVRLSPDQSLLVVADATSKWVWSYQVQQDGSLANGQPFYRLDHRTIRCPDPMAWPSIPKGSCMLRRSRVSRSATNRAELSPF